MEQISEINGLKNKEGAVIDGVQYIVIRLGEEQYGIDIKYIDNIVRMQNITRVPKVQPYLLGVINLRGEVIPVMSLRKKMSLPADEITKTTRIIILKLEQLGSVGVLVDEVREVVTLTSDDIDKLTHPNKDGKQNFVSGVGKKDKELVSILDLNAVTAEENA